MSDLLVSVFVVVFTAQFLLWLVVQRDVRGSEDATLRWLGTIALFPLLGLFVSVWYLLSDDVARRGGSDSPEKGSH
jgi:H+/Cl- antiporter ClcA